MNKKILTTTLVDLGLSEKEARVYLAALSLGPSSLLKIAGEAELNRTTCYPIVRSLKNKGLLSTELRGFKEYLVPEKPEMVEKILELKKEKFLQLLPDFNSLYTTHRDERQLQYYEGTPAIKHLYEGLLKDIRTREPYLVISDEERWLGIDEHFFTHFLEKRARLNAEVRMLLQDSLLARTRKKFERNLNHRIKLLPPKINLETNLVITPRQIIIHQLVSPPLAIVIRNHTTIRTLQQCFELLWQAF